MRKTFLVMSRLIDLFVDILPIDELGFKHVKLQSEGRPPYNPATLLKLYLYGYNHFALLFKKLLENQQKDYENPIQPTRQISFIT
jgi:transposase